MTLRVGVKKLFVILTAMAALVAMSASALADPPGNNGTVKIDGVDFDDHPNNEPHVGCTFQVDFYGFDKGQLFADVIFTTQPPTRPAGEVVLSDTVFIGEDDNSGGGSQAGLDASETYTLDLTGYSAHPIQGHHIKLTVHADGSQGADTKHKVFWVEDCGSGSSEAAPSGGQSVDGGDEGLASAEGPGAVDAESAGFTGTDLMLMLLALAVTVVALRTFAVRRIGAGSNKDA